jgi:hypothetical protein
MFTQIPIGGRPAKRAELNNITILSFLAEVGNFNVHLFYVNPLGHGFHPWHDF